MYATISSKGQITIPAALRALFGWRTGDAIDFVVCEETSRVELVTKRAPDIGLRVKLPDYENFGR